MRAIRDERGETLVELLITVMVIAIGVVAVVASLSSSVIGSDTHRGLAQGEVVLRDYGEAIKQKAIDAAAFTSCPTKAQVTPTFTFPTGWSGSVSTVEYWVPTTGSFPNGTWSAPDNATTCNQYYTTCGNPGLPSCDAGLQRVTYTISNSRTDYAKATLTSRVLIRRNNAP
jgi:type II secretory pathway pseudopilin PulG